MHAYTYDRYILHIIDENRHLKYLFISFNNLVIFSNCVSHAVVSESLWPRGL